MDREEMATLVADAGSRRKTREQVVHVLGMFASGVVHALERFDSDENRVVAVRYLLLELEERLRAVVQLNNDWHPPSGHSEFVNPPQED